MTRAADGTWTNSTSNSTWGTDTNWASNTIADGADFTAYFNTLDLAAARTVTLSAPVTIGNLYFADTASSYFTWTLTGSTLTLDTTTGTAPTVDVATSSTATIGAVIDGNDGLTKTGAGILALSGANTYTGLTTVNAGTLRSSVATAITGDVIVNTGATLNFEGTTGTTFVYEGTVSGAGKITKTSGGSTLSLLGSNTHTGGTALTDGRLILGTGTNNGLGTGTFTLTGGSLQSVDNTTRTIANALSMGSNSLSFGAVQGATTGLGDLTFTYGTTISIGGGKTWTVTNGTTVTFANSWSGNTGWTTTKAGTGTLVFNGNYGTNTNTLGLTINAGTMILNGSNNQYTGTTNVNGGTLYVNGTKSSSVGAVNVNSGGTLAGVGNIAGAATAASGAYLSAGSTSGATGTLTFTTSLDLSGLAAGTGGLVFELGAVGSSDKISAASLTFGTGLLDLDDFSFTTLAGFGEGTYTLLSSSSSIAGSTLGSNVTGVLGGYQTALSIYNNDVILTVTSAVPETATFALLSGLGILGFAATRRKRRV